jgi:hypothetical protein
MKILITENQMRKVQFKFLNYLFEDMYEVESKKYPDSRFWKKDDKVILELRDSGFLWVSHLIWDDISNTFLLDKYETKILIKDWVEQNLELGVFTPWKKIGWNNI